MAGNAKLGRCVKGRECTCAHAPRTPPRWFVVLILTVHTHTYICEYLFAFLFIWSHASVVPNANGCWSEEMNKCMIWVMVRLMGYPFTPYFWWNVHRRYVLMLQFNEQATLFCRSPFSAFIEHYVIFVGMANGFLPLHFFHFGYFVRHSLITVGTTW